MLMMYFFSCHPDPLQIISVNVEVIDLDDDEASDADMAMFLQDNFDTNNKGKGLYHHSDHQLKVCYQSICSLLDLCLLSHRSFSFWKHWKYDFL